MVDPAVVPGPSAGWLDVRRRLLNLLAVAVPIAVGLLLQALRVPIIAIGAVLLVLFAAGLVASIVVGRRVTRAMRAEAAAGYSTLYDVAGFDLRHARTLEVLRPASVAPQHPGSRSLVAGLFRVKPGTVLAKRLDDDES